MKKLFSFVMLGAFALAGATMFNSCTSEDAVPVNPTFDGESVKTQFTIAFPSNVAETRMTADAVQNAQTVEKFRGMDNIVLIPFSVQGDANADPITNALTPLGEGIVLTNMIKPTETTVTNSIPAATLTTTKGNAVLYNDVTVPVGTGSFLFYGKAIDNGTEKFVNGALTPTIDATKTPADYRFDPVAIYSSGTSTIGTALANYVTAIAAATGWASVTAAQNEGLKNLYDNFTSLKAGSSRDVQAAVLDLYQSLYKNTDDISKAIVTKILTKATAPATPDGTLTFSSDLGTVTNTINATSEDATYPGDLKIPDGAAVLNWDKTVTPYTATQVLDGNTSNVANITGKFTDYVYPASLYYLANSGVLTATTYQKDNYDGSKDWAGATGSILAGYTAGKSVQSSSRSVAIVDQIQYAVGRLDTKVTAAAATLYDRKGDKVEGTDASRFPITGVLIGGQKPVDYMFTNPIGTAEFTIYDNIHKANNGTFPYATTSGSDYNYTLALETAKDVSVYVAVEFLNKSGQDFQGADGVVPEGGKFYLVAQLNPTTGTGYNATNLNSVFKQDFNTIANFTIGAGAADADNDGVSDSPAGLANAYNTIPDLRTPKLELGLSVNLEWQAGITFNHTF